MTSLIIAFLCGSLACLIACFICSIIAQSRRNNEIAAAIENARRRAYARGYEEGALHGRGYFIARQGPALTRG